MFTLPPSSILRSPTGDKPWYLCQGKFATIYTSPSTWGNQRGELHRSTSSKFLAPLPGTPIYKIGELHTIFYLCFLVLLVYLSVFAFVSFTKNTKKLVTLLAADTMGSTENTKLCDFTSHNKNDFICTPIAPPTTSAPSYEIKPALLNLVMKDQFSGVGEDAALHLNNFF